jgi:hypothetical protein
VGHTHEDIDQRFSKIAHALRGSSALTLGSFLNLLRDSYEVPYNTAVTLTDEQGRKRPYVELLENALDWKHFLEPMVPARNLAGIKYQGGFQVTLSPSAEIKLFYRPKRNDGWVGPVFPFTRPDTLSWPQYPALVPPAPFVEFVGEGATEGARATNTLVHTLSEMDKLGAFVQVGLILHLF